MIDYDQFCGIPGAGAAAQSEREVPVISVADLKRRLEARDNLLLLDVRETYEHSITQVPGTKLMPLGELPARMSELDSAQEIALLCKNGARSAQAVRALQDAGFSRLYNVAGGIDAWAREVDPEMPKY